MTPQCVLLCSQLLFIQLLVIRAILGRSAFFFRFIRHGLQQKGEK